MNIFSTELTRVEKLYLSMTLHFQKKKGLPCISNTPLNTLHE